MEFEVYKEAVNIYKEKYSIYSEWDIEGSDTKGRPFRESMPGYYLSSTNHPDCTIVGDVLTSNKIWGNGQNRDNVELCCWLKKYESMYHMDGNYMPIPEIRGYPSANLRGHNCDTFTHHLNICREAIEGTLNTYITWQKWAKSIWIPYCEFKNQKEYWKFFIREFYFIDFVDDDLDPLSFVLGRDKADQVGIRAEDEDAKVIETIQNKINLFTKRDYRIKYNKKDIIDWSEEKDYEKHCDMLQEKMKKVINI